jgi:hypothetical protein
MGKSIKYLVIGIVIIIVALIAINAALFVTGLAGITISPTQPSGNTIRVNLEVPNRSFIPIQGEVRTQVFDSITGRTIGSGNDTFKLEPGKANPVAINVQIAESTQNPIKLKMDYSLMLFGVLIHITSTEVTMPPL